MLAINGMPDHIHLLVGMRPNQSVLDLIKEVKQASSRWINDRRFCKSHFAWQEGFGAFSYSRSQLPDICKYIEDQKEHHHQKDFLEEYKQILQLVQVEFDEDYIFIEPE